MPKSIYIYTSHLQKNETNTVQQKKINEVLSSAVVNSYYYTITLCNSSNSLKYHMISFYKFLFDDLLCNFPYFVVDYTYDGQ